MGLFFDEHCTQRSRKNLFHRQPASANMVQLPDGRDYIRMPVRFIGIVRGALDVKCRLMDISRQSKLVLLFNCIQLRFSKCIHDRDVDKAVLHFECLYLVR